MEFEMYSLSRESAGPSLLGDSHCEENRGEGIAQATLTGSPECETYHNYCRPPQ